jgi:trimethylamine:corrinoid methyltransferase-like protein
MRTAHYLPELSDRLRRRPWRKKGSMDIVQKAKRKVDEILATQNVPPLSPEKLQAIDNYIAEIAKRSYEDYKIAEGMTESKTVTVDHVDITEDSVKK